MHWNGMRADARGPSEPRAPSARGEARAWRYGATSVLLLGLVAARPSTAQPLDGEPAPASAARARLQFASGLCVTRAALGDGVEAMLGRTVFDDDPEARAAELAVEGEERAEGARRVVRFVLRRADGSLVGERVLRAP
ncbi:MAG: hypothetical protein RMK74_04120 [Myxococcales bacterium]|nr:hypothetical protein [Myxococcales bacterium]